MFLTSVSGKFQTEIGKSWAAEVNSRRKEGCGKQEPSSNFHGNVL
jgi:putative hydrolases of HD superfamily